MTTDGKRALAAGSVQKDQSAQIHQGPALVKGAANDDRGWQFSARRGQGGLRVQLKLSPVPFERLPGFLVAYPKVPPDRGVAKPKLPEYSGSRCAFRW